MNELTAFPITHKWPAQHPERLQLYSLPTPNGVKVSIMLEEIGLPYEVHLIDFGKNDQLTPAFISLSPNNKIPAILDPNGPGGKPLALLGCRSRFWIALPAICRMALLAVQRAQAVHPRTDHRHRIEHIGDMRPNADLLGRIRAAGILVVTTPQFS